LKIKLISSTLFSLLSCAFFASEAFSEPCSVESSKFNNMSVDEINSLVSMSIDTSAGVFSCNWRSLAINEQSSWVCEFKNTITSLPNKGSVVLGEKIALGKNSYWFYLKSIASKCSSTEFSDVYDATYEVYHQVPNSGWAPITKSRIKVKQQFSR